MNWGAGWRLETPHQDPPETPSSTEMLSAVESLADPQGGPCSLFPSRTLPGGLWPTGVFTEDPTETLSPPQPHVPRGDQAGALVTSPGCPAVAEAEVL